MVNQGDIFYVGFNPSQEYEQKNRRPAIALSHDMVSKTSNMTIVAPISSTKRNFPLYYPLKETKEVYGKVLLDQTIALDLKARNVTKKNIIEKFSRRELEDILHLCQLLFSIDDDYEN